MKEFKIGGKITLEDNTSYRIIDIIKEGDIEYYFCCTTENNIEPKVLEKKMIADKVYMRIIEDPKLLEKIARIVLEKDS